MYCNALCPHVTGILASYWQMFKKRGDVFDPCTSFSGWKSDDQRPEREVSYGAKSPKASTHFPHFLISYPTDTQ